MYNNGILQFLTAKRVNPKKAIETFLSHRNVTSFTAKNHDRASDFIQDNWNSFASWVDNSIKSGILQGKRVKLNTSYQERAEYKEKIRKEFEQVGVTKEEHLLFNKIRKEYGVGFIQSFLNKKGIQSLGKDYSYFSKTLQWLPLVKQAIENGILEQETNKC